MTPTTLSILAGTAVAPCWVAFCVAALWNVENAAGVPVYLVVTTIVAFPITSIVAHWIGPDAFSDASILREIHSHRHRNFGNLLGCVLPLLDLGTPEVRNANRLLAGVALVVLGIFCDAGSIRQYCYL
jgi:hypothetical protein